jgi:hypothetical protein
MRPLNKIDVVFFQKIFSCCRHVSPSLVMLEHATKIKIIFIIQYILFQNIFTIITSRSLNLSIWYYQLLYMKS